MAFKTKKRVNPNPKQEEGYDDEEYEEEEEEELEEQTKSEVSEPVKENKVTVQDILINHEDRIKSIEATLFRLSRI